MNVFLNYSRYDVMTLLGRYGLLRLRRKSKYANTLSQKRLIEFLHKNKNMQYGKTYNFQDINSYEDFKNMVPITDYRDYDGYIKQMIKS